MDSALLIAALALLMIIVFLISLISINRKMRQKKMKKRDSTIVDAATAKAKAKATNRAGAADENKIVNTKVGLSSLQGMYGRSRIMLSFSQIFSGFTLAVEMDWPPALTSIMRSFLILNLNLSDIIGVIDACTFHVPFMTNFCFIWFFCLCSLVPLELLHSLHAFAEETVH